MQEINVCVKLKFVMIHRKCLSFVSGPIVKQKTDISTVDREKLKFLLFYLFTLVHINELHDIFSVGKAVNPIKNQS